MDVADRKLYELAKGEHLISLVWKSGKLIMLLPTGTRWRWELGKDNRERHENHNDSTWSRLQDRTGMIVRPFVDALTCYCFLRYTLLQLRLSQPLTTMSLVRYNYNYRARWNESPLSLSVHLFATSKRSSFFWYNKLKIQIESSKKKLEAKTALIEFNWSPYAVRSGYFQTSPKVCGQLYAQ